MNKLKIYPGWQNEGADALIDALRQLRAFYRDASANGRAVVTCLV
jgi:hypothetical protein